MNYKKLISDKLKLFGECKTRNMSIKALEYDAINLAQGFPEDDPPPEMLEVAIRAIKGHRNYYADMRGDPLLREAVSNYFWRFNKVKINPDDNVTITCGTTEAMLISLIAILNPGDELILFEPWYENYSAQAVLAEANVKYFLLEPPNYKLDFEKLETLFSEKTKAIIINTPNNPTGRVLNKIELQFIAELCMKYDVIAIVDEIYQHIVFDDNVHISLASLDGMFDRTITINGISKAFSATGWRVGWAIAPREITIAIRRVHDFVTATVPTPFQDAAIIGLSLPDSFFQHVKKVYHKKRKILSDALIQAGFTFFKPEGTYYILADISKFGFNNSETFTNILLKEAKVAVVPGTAYYKDKYYVNRVVRFTFSKNENMLIEGAQRIIEWSKKLG